MNRKFFAVFLFLALFLVSFQNCQPGVQVQNLPSKESGEDDGGKLGGGPGFSTGNGGIFEGKQTYQILAINSECGDEPVKEQIEVRDDGYYLIRQNCQDIAEIRLNGQELTIGQDTLVYDSRVYFELLPYSCEDIKGMGPENGTAMYWVIDDQDNFKQIECTFDLPVDEKTFYFPGTYEFVVPAGITEVTAVVVGSGGGGAEGLNGGPSGGGGGGALVYGNAIAVTPGEKIRVVVGLSGYEGQDGQDSEFGQYLIGGGGKGGGLAGGLGGLPGGSGMTGGGAGGSGGASPFGGGGGAGGYSGNGGNGGSDGPNVPATDGLGGAAGGGASGEGAAGGGGVEVWGESFNGRGAPYNPDRVQQGEGGSQGYGGESKNNGENYWVQSGAFFGGGGGGGYGGSEGGHGIVRVLWGHSRSFPFDAPDIYPEDL